MANAQLTFTIMPFPNPELQTLIKGQVADMKKEIS